jgi:hypothetical protein
MRTTPKIEPLKAVKSDDFPELSGVKPPEIDLDYN